MCKVKLSDHKSMMFRIKLSKGVVYRKFMKYIYFGRLL